MKKNFKIFYTTCSNIKDAKIIATFLLENRNALCVNLIKNIESFYLQNTKIQNDKEVALLIKTYCTRVQMETNIKKFINMTHL